MGRLDSEVAWFQAHGLLSWPDYHQLTAFFADGPNGVDGLRTATMQFVVGDDGTTTNAVLSPDGSRAVSTGSDHVITVWGVANGTELARMRGHRSGGFSM